ncbi:MAG: GNAT family N-acetyltransferase [Acidimicrobiales bacterium]
MRWSAPEGFYLSDERGRIDVARVHHWLSEESYWARGRTLEVVERSLDASLVIGLFDADDVQVGIARWVSDGATFAWLSDVFIDAPFRGRGLGRVLIATALAHPGVQGVQRRLLATSDAHEFYRAFGFHALSEPSRWMELRATT